MRPLGNDRWVARLPAEAIGTYDSPSRAWRDAFATWRDELEKKHAAGVNTGLEIRRGRASSSRGGTGGNRLAGTLPRCRPAAARMTSGRAVLLSPETAALMARGRSAPLRVRTDPRCRCRPSAPAPVRQLVRAVPALAERRSSAARHLRRRRSATCRASATWASTCSISRRSTRSARTNRKGRNNTPDAGAGRSRQPLCDRLGGGRARRDPPAARHARGFPPAASQAAAAQGWRSRWISPSSARRTIPGCKRAPGLVRLAAGRHDPLCREPAEEVRGHRQRRFLRHGRGARLCGSRCATWSLFWVGAGRAAVPRRQPAHQAVPVLGMADRRRARALSGRDLPRRGLHPAEGDVPAGQDRLLAVLHLLHLAQHQAGAAANT